MRICLRRMVLALAMICIVAFASPSTVFAGSLDDLSNGSTQSSSSNSTNQDGDGKDSISDYLKGYNPVTSENMQKAGTMASPIVTALGTISGFIVMIVSAGIFVVTALDLCYIGIPFLRPTLNPNQASGGSSPMMGMGMGMSSMGGMQGGSVNSGRRCWVSDEAIACVNLAGGQQGGASMGMSPMGMSPMGMMGGMGQQPSQVSTKSVIVEYLKKRSFFLIIFTIATVILMSSIFTNCGLNLAELLTKIIAKFNGQVSNVNI